MFHNKRKSQISLIILLGIVIFIIVGVFLYERSQVVREPQIKQPSDIASLQLFIDSCVEKTAKEAVSFVASQGGYYIPPENSLIFWKLNIPYYRKDGNYHIPNLDNIKDSLLFYMIDNIPHCANLSIFIERGYKIETGELQVNVSINPKNVLFDVEYPIRVYTDNKETYFSDFGAVVNTNFLVLYNSAVEYMDYQKNENSSLLISKLMDISRNNNLNFEVSSIGMGSVIISFIDKKIHINNKPLVFSFAVDYSIGSG
ncbi:MAG: hypothetical protein QXG86_03805 [Candidatus Woesearchaeota archaeon]